MTLVVLPVARSFLTAARSMGDGCETATVTLSAEIAATFSLGGVEQPLILVAEGWGGHNRMFRLETTGGSWAVKRQARQVADDPEGAFIIEMAAMAGGVSMARPVAAKDGRCWASIDGRQFRCHAWVDGEAKQNEETSTAEAAAMGRIVGQLHGLEIPCAPPLRSPAMDPVRWSVIAAAGRARAAPWVDQLCEGLDQLVTISGQARPTDLGRDELVGSHRDLNAHNALFTAQGLCLIDWDAAGPAWPRWERADFALRWAERPDDSYDEAAIQSFLRGYLDGGGVLESDDPLVLVAAPAALVPWVLQNLEMAVDQPSELQDSLAHALVGALLSMPSKVRFKQGLLADCLARL